MFLLFDSWAARHAPALSQKHPMVALPCVLLIMVLLSIRFWPVRHGAAAKVKAHKKRAAPRSTAWRDIAKNASAALLERGFILAHHTHTDWEPGADLVLTRDGRTYIVHARCWRDKSIDVQAVRELARDIAQRGAAGGMLLCPDGAFTEQARKLAHLHGIATLGRADLVDEIQHGSQQASARKPAPLDVTLPLPLQPRPADHEAARAAAPSPSRPAPVAAAAAPARPQLRPDDQVNVRRDFAATVPMNKADMLPRAVPAPPPVFAPTEPMSVASRAQPKAEHQVMPPPSSADAKTAANARRDFSPTIPMSKADMLPRAVPAPPPVFDPAEPAPAASRVPPRPDHEIMPASAYASTAAIPLTKLVRGITR